MEYIKKCKRKRSKKTKFLIWLISILCLVGLVWWYFYAIVNPIIVQTSEAKIKSLTQHTLTNAVLNVASSSDAFNNLIKYQYGADNEISLISVNSYDANMMARQISATAQTQLDNATATGVEVHIGAFTGIAVLATSGPVVKVNLAPIGTVTVSFKSEFTSAGINQTLHKIFVEVKSSVYVVLPSAHPKIDASTEVLITETVIVGKIPETYLQSSYLDEMLNLVPA